MQDNIKIAILLKNSQNKQPISVENKNRITILDTFRGLAAIGVVYYHYTHSFRLEHGHSFPSFMDINSGLYFVLLFFIISGFVIFLTIEKCKNAAEFAFRRFTRLYPTFWTCMLITSFVLIVFPYENDTITLHQIIANLTMVPRFLHSKAIDGAYWSLIPELLFYSIVFVLFLVKKIQNVFLWGSIWLSISFINGFFELRFGDLLFQYAGLFFAGIMFYKIFTGDKRLINHIFILICYLITIVNFFDITPLPTPNHIEFIVCLTIIFLLFYGFIYHKVNFLNNKLLLFLGYISYPLYLIHQEVGITLLLYLKTKNLTGYWTIFLPMALSILIAYLIVVFIEKPVMKAAKNINKKLFYSKVSQPEKVPELKTQIQ